MSDLRNQLERLGERAKLASDAFERLERARRRRERHRRITAGTVALLVAIAGSVAAFSAFRGSGGQVAGASGGAGVTTPAPAGPADVAGFTCDSTGTIAPSSLTVDAQRDGVHVAVTNTADERIPSSSTRVKSSPGWMVRSMKIRPLPNRSPRSSWIRPA